MVNLNRIKAHLSYRPLKHKQQLIALKNDMHDAVTKSEGLHTCEIVFVVEETLSLSWMLASIQRRANFMYKKMKLHKLQSKKGILIYLGLLDKQLEIRVGNGVQVPQENWTSIINEGLALIDNEGIHKGCLGIVQKITDELVKYEKNETLNANEISNDLVVK
jgi:uncharacterized membrane protein